MHIKILGRQRRFGHKSFKNKVSILLCMNILDTEKLKPILIGRYKNTRCFKNFKVKKYVNYYNNRKRWMTAEVFNKFLID